MQRPRRIVLHLDMDAFFAAVEQRDRPELRGRPVIIGHRGRRGVVATCSYEARRFGVHSAMPSVTAERLCPEAVWISARHRHYAAISRGIFRRLRRQLPVVEPVSIDEAYADLTGFAPDFEKARETARSVKAGIGEIEGLSCSVGLAGCRFVAKIASDLDKPDGLVVIPPEGFLRIAGPLPVGRIPGIGPKSEARLARLGIRTIADLHRADERLLRSELGKAQAWRLAARARGEDETPIGARHERRQISEERTYVDDLHEPAEIARELRARAEGVARSLRRRRLLARTVVLKARDGAFRTLTRSKTLDEPTDLGEELHAAALSLWRDRVDFGERGVRLLGLAGANLVSQRDLSLPLFPDQAREKARRIARARDRLADRFGPGAVLPGSLLPGGEEE